MPIRWLWDAHDTLYRNRVKCTIHTKRPTHKAANIPPFEFSLLDLVWQSSNGDSRHWGAKIPRLSCGVAEDQNYRITA